MIESWSSFWYGFAASVVIDIIIFFSYQAGKESNKLPSDHDKPGDHKLG